MATYLYNVKDGYSYKKADLMEQIKKLLVEKDQEVPKDNSCLSIVVKLRDSELPMAIYGFTFREGENRLEEAIKDAEASSYFEGSSALFKMR